MATNIDINITDLSGHTFTIKLNWDIGIMKCQVAGHYDEQYTTNFCNEKGITKDELYTTQKYLYEFINSDYFNSLKAVEQNCQLIYKGKILEQFHIDTDIYSDDDFKKDNNMNVVIIKNDEHDENDDDDNDSIISFISD